MIRQYLPKSTEELIQWYERRVAPVSLATGFVLDNIIFRAIDFWAITALLLVYLSLAVAGIFLINLVTTGRLQNPLVLRVAPFFPVVVQFAFGGIFSGFFVLYSESATLAVSWVSVVFLAFLLVGNERLRRRYMRFRFQVSVLFIAVFGFLIFLVPLIANRINSITFLVSGVISVAFIALFVIAVRDIMPELAARSMVPIARAVGIIFIVFNILYFTNAIPPLPLALKEADVYHRVERIGGEYHVLAEDVPWYQRYLPLTEEFHRAPGESLYAFSSVFAPSGLKVTIHHEWQRYDTETEEWTTVARVDFPIQGGRDGGYRGFSQTANSQAGDWRVNVKTSSGQLVGRIAFRVVNVSAPVELEERVL